MKVYPKYDCRHNGQLVTAEKGLEVESLKGLDSNFWSQTTSVVEDEDVNELEQDANFALEDFGDGDHEEDD